MQCKSCEYPLWNLRARQCPECGAPFLPSEQEFVINSVRFCCPNCNQGYYGTGAKGHLVPSAFTCVKCAQAITMDEMVLLPAEGVTDHQTQVARAPWLDRERIGAIKGFFGTLFQGLFLPNRLVRGVPPSSSVWSALVYAMITAGAITAVAILPFMAFIGLATMAFGGGAGGGGPALATLSFYTLVTFLFAWAGMLVFLVIWALVTHGILLVTGGANWPIQRTFHAICYSIGAAVFFAVPLFGLYFAFIPMLWWMVSALVMVAIGQKVHPGRAILATAVMPILSIVLAYGGLIALFYYSAVNAGATIATQMTVSATTTGQNMRDDLVTLAQANGGVYPKFGLVLLDVGYVTLDEFIMDISFTSVGTVKFGEQSLFDLRSMPSDQLQARTQQIADAMPDDVVAHRIGDVVFTYHGMAFDPTEGALWIMVLAPPRDTPAGTVTFSPDFADQVTVVVADGSTTTLPLDAFAAALEAQNALRLARDLPALPDPLSITLDEPVARATGEREAYIGAAPVPEAANEP
jgi:hypothetical protein